MKQLTLTIIFALLAFTGFAQPKKIAFEKYGVAEGLPEEFVTSLLQDDKGFIWAATQNGLVKYDGYRFKVYKYTTDGKQTTNLHIRNLFGGIIKAKDGKIWIGGGSSTDEGTIASFDPVTEKFRHYFLPEMINEKRRGTSYLVHEDTHQNIWFGYLPEYAGYTQVVYLCKLNPKDGVIKTFPDLLMLRTMILPNRKNTETLDSSVWMLDTHSNLRKWNYEKDSLEVIIPAGRSLTTTGMSDTIRWISKANDKHLFLSSDQTICVYDVHNQQVIKYFISSCANGPGKVSGNIIAAMEDKMGYYWLMHSGGILTRIHPETDHIQTFVYGKAQLAFPDAPESLSYPFYVRHQNKNGIWFESYGGLNFGTLFLYFDFALQNFSFYNNNFNLTSNQLPHGRSYSFLEDRTGLLWLYTRPGMYKQSPKNWQMELFRHNAGSFNGLPSDSISYLLEDSKKRLWIGTRNGLAVYQPETANFRILRHDPTNASTISHNSITAIAEDADGKIWVGTRNGLNQWQESTGHFKRFLYNSKESNYCLGLFSDKQHRLWLSVRNKGVFVMDKVTGKILKSFIPDINNPFALSSTAISIIYQDYYGNIWLGADNRTNSGAGLFRLNKAEDGFFPYQPNPGDSCSVSDRRIFFIAEDGKKRLWIGSNEGLNLYVPANDHFTVFYDNTVICITGFCIDKMGEPWFGTYAGSGLVSVDVQKGIHIIYDESKGLLHNDLGLLQNSHIAVDDFGRFWLPTQRGLSVFDPESRSFFSYLEKDGFQPYSGSYITYKTSNGDIWIGGYHGLNRIVPADLMKKDSTLPAIVITQVKILDSLYSIPDGKIFKKSVAYTDGFELKYWQKDITFDFVALHYLRPEDNLYSWKLENYDKDWSVPSKERKASYTNLSPGDYVFRVKASNADGIWNEKGVSITMTILPPWWLTWWAYILYGVLLLFAMRSYSLWRLRYLRLEKEHLQVKVEERTSELKKSLEEIKSTQAQLIASEKLASLGALTAGIAHEIQNPLNFVNNFSEVNTELIDEALDENEKRNHLEVKSILNGLRENESKIIHHGKRAESIVKGMLLHSRGNSGHKEPTDINALCDEYLRLSYHGFRAKDKAFNADFKLEADPSLLKIEVVPQDIGRVLLNLINNAFYAVSSDFVKTTHALSPHGSSPHALSQSPPDKPCVIVATNNLGKKIEISVKDNGPGIPAEIVDKIFQPFFTTKPTGQGTGLGLSLAYDIVKAHDGEIKLETIDGEGSEFIIQLPVV